MSGKSDVSRGQLLVFGYIRMIKNADFKLVVPSPIYFMILNFHSKFDWIDKTVTIQVVGNEDNRKTALNQHLSVHGTGGYTQHDTINETSILVISHNNKLKKGIWKIKEIKNNQFIICHIRCFDRRKRAQNFYLGKIATFNCHTNSTIYILS